MSKKCVTFISLIIILVLSCFLITSCGFKNNQGDVPVEIVVTGASKSNRITIYAENEKTSEIVKVETKKWSKYSSSQTLDYGDYTITKVKSNDKDYKLTVITPEFSVKEQDLNQIEIHIEEEDLSGTLLGFLKNNAFTLIVIVVLSIALLIVKQRKKNFITKSDTKIE